MWPTTALAQMPPDIAEKIAAMGRVIELDKTGKIYEPLHEKEPHAGIKVMRDVKYGTQAASCLACRLNAWTREIITLVAPAHGS